MKASITNVIYYSYWYLNENDVPHGAGIL